jgi:hypothetical protein
MLACTRYKLNLKYVIVCTGECWLRNFVDFFGSLSH